MSKQTYQQGKIDGKKEAMEGHCKYCKKIIGEPGKIYISGSICQGHKLSPFAYLLWKLLKLKI